jgi:hypothetical protein
MITESYESLSQKTGVLFLQQRVDAREWKNLGAVFCESGVSGADQLHCSFIAAAASEAADFELRTMIDDVTVALGFARNLTTGQLEMRTYRYSSGMPHDRDGLYYEADVVTGRVIDETDFGGLKKPHLALGIPDVKDTQAQKILFERVCEHIKATRQAWALEHVDRLVA